MIALMCPFGYKGTINMYIIFEFTNNNNTQ